MTLVTGKAPAAVNNPGAFSISNDGKPRIFGYTLDEINEVLNNIKELMRLRQGVPAQAEHRTIAPPIPGPEGAVPAPQIAAPVKAKCDILLEQVADMIHMISKNGAREAKLSDILTNSAFTLGQLDDQLQKVIKQ